LLLVGRREMVGLDLDEVVELAGVDVSAVVGSGSVLVGSGSFVGSAEGLEDFFPPSPEPPSELPALKTTTFAVAPLGTVTTQKLAPPAPEACWALVTPPTPSLDGSMEHGVPLHSPPEQTILTPKVGGVPERCDSMKIGFQATFAYVIPLESVLAPATKGDQFPIGSVPSPQTQAFSTPTPGGLT
jgi:hypothetical protein